jgi:hypothetical protein
MIPIHEHVVGQFWLQRQQARKHPRFRIPKHVAIVAIANAGQTAGRSRKRAIGTQRRGEVVPATMEISK